ncbi:hypothetical protein [Nostoc sp.]|uniref:hypothetical protein n=1 Tax=Nostoc sp. TaxID=1180 RepID=UPI002FFBF11A
MVDTSFIIYLFIQAYWGEICSSFCVKTSLFTNICRAIALYQSLFTPLSKPFN